MLAVARATQLVLVGGSLLVFSTLAALAATDLGRRGRTGWALAAVVMIFLFFPVGLAIWFIGRSADASAEERRRR